MTKKTKTFKGWIILCDREANWRAFSVKKKALEHQEILNYEYKGVCKHKVVACEIRVK